MEAESFQDNHAVRIVGSSAPPSNVSFPGVSPLSEIFQRVHNRKGYVFPRKRASWRNDPVYPSSRMVRGHHEGTFSFVYIQSSEAGWADTPQDRF